MLWAEHTHKTTSNQKYAEISLAQSNLLGRIRVLMYNSKACENTFSSTPATGVRPTASGYVEIVANYSAFVAYKGGSSLTAWGSSPNGGQITAEQMLDILMP